jgi:ABC-type protease/lipase transport system fused ATPase/permease subunit
LSLGLNVIGVPSAGGSGALLAQVIRRLSPTDVAVVADGDDAGKAGANRLAGTLSSLVPTRILAPPGGIKDARAWVTAGADRETLIQAANQTPVHRLAERSLFDE